MNTLELIPSKKYLIRLHKGEEILESLKSFCKENNIESGFAMMIGAISSVNLALYELNKKEYFRKSFDGAFEIASMSGNITKMNGELITHIHGIYSDKNFETIAGHVDRAVVSATCEILLTTFENKISRQKSEEIGLNLLDL